MRTQNVRRRAGGRVEADDVLPEYDFGHAEPNRYAARYALRNKAPECEVQLQRDVPLDKVAPFTLGFSNEQARQTFIAETGARPAAQ
jgi:hypothetical protein